jgi:putative FmdB family regulatory protein
MPIYEYQCPECGRIQEVLIAPGDRDDAIPCDRCGASQAQRVLSAHAAAPAFSRPKGHTCCGREERCATPPCASEGTCRNA